MESKDVQGEEVDVRKDGEQDSRDNAENSSEIILQEKEDGRCVPDAKSSTSTKVSAEESAQNDLKTSGQSGKEVLRENGMNGESRNDSEESAQNDVDYSAQNDSDADVIVEEEEGYKSDRSASDNESDVPHDRLRRQESSGYEESDENEESRSDVPDDSGRRSESEGYEEEEGSEEEYETVEEEEIEVVVEEEDESEGEEEVEVEKQQEKNSGKKGPVKSDDNEKTISKEKENSDEEDGWVEQEPVNSKDIETKQEDEKENDVKSPVFVPRHPGFWDHDDRGGDTQKPRSRPPKDGRKLWDRTTERWEHDKYREEEQGPKAEWEKEETRRELEEMRNQRFRNRRRMGDFMENAQGERRPRGREGQRRGNYRQFGNERQQESNGPEDRNWDKGNPDREEVNNRQRGRFSEGKDDYDQNRPNERLQSDRRGRPNNTEGRGWNRGVGKQNDYGWQRNNVNWEERPTGRTDRKNDRYERNEERNENDRNTSRQRFTKGRSDWGQENKENEGRRWDGNRVGERSRPREEKNEPVNKKEWRAVNSRGNNFDNSEKTERNRSNQLGRNTDRRNNYDDGNERKQNISNRRRRDNDRKKKETNEESEFWWDDHDTFGHSTEDLSTFEENVHIEPDVELETNEHSYRRLRTKQWLESDYQRKQEEMVDKSSSYRDEDIYRGEKASRTNRNPKLKTAEFGTQTEPPPGSRGRGKGIVSDRLNKARKTANDFDKERVKKDRRRVQRARRDSSEDEEEDRYEDVEEESHHAEHPRHSRKEEAAQQRTSSKPKRYSSQRLRQTNTSFDTPSQENIVEESHENVQGGPQYFEPMSYPPPPLLVNPQILALLQQQIQQLQQQQQQIQMQVQQQQHQQQSQQPRQQTPQQNFQEPGPVPVLPPSSGPHGEMPPPLHVQQILQQQILQLQQRHFEQIRQRQQQQQQMLAAESGTPQEDLRQPEMMVPNDNYSHEGPPTLQQNAPVIFPNITQPPPGIYSQANPHYQLLMNQLVAARMYNPQQQAGLFIPPVQVPQTHVPEEGAEQFQRKLRSAAIPIKPPPTS